MDYLNISFVVYLLTLPIVQSQMVNGFLLQIDFLTLAASGFVVTWAPESALAAASVDFVSGISLVVDP